MSDEFTYIKEAKIWNCNNCGAYHKKKKKIKHYSTCTPGESKKWEKIYGEQKE